MAKKKNSVWKKLIKRFLGLLLILGAVFVYGSIVFYHAGDNALNLATSNGVKNLLGLVGAKTADFCLSFFGCVLPIFLLVFFPWGLNRLKLNEFINPYSRVFAWILGICCATAFGAALPLYDGRFNFGGAVGEALLSHLMTFVNIIYPYAYGDVFRLRNRNVGRLQVCGRHAGGARHGKHGRRHGRIQRLRRRTNSCIRVMRRNETN